MTLTRHPATIGAALKAAGGEERAHPRRRPRKGRRREPPDAERERLSGRQGGTAGATKREVQRANERRRDSKAGASPTERKEPKQATERAREPQSGAQGEKQRAPCAQTERRTKASDTERAGGSGGTPTPPRERAPSQSRTAVRRLAIKERGKKPQWGFLGRDARKRPPKATGRIPMMFPEVGASRHRGERAYRSGTPLRGGERGARVQTRKALRVKVAKHSA